uniref:Uncharacterized protein n=1 Tax=Anguilla anguilla TaxID=7936 RepID=A0A0E9QL83_ANGAN
MLNQRHLRVPGMCSP